MNKTRFTNRQILHIAGPILISLLMEQMIGMTDTAFLGRVGEIELGASALASVYYLAIFMLGFGFSAGVQIMISRRNGEGNYTAIGAIFNQGLFFLVGLATVIFFLTRFGSPIVLRLLIDSDRIYEATLQYMNWRIFGFFFSFSALMFRAFYVGIADTRTLTANSLVMVGTNVLLNYILIFGKLGFPALGIAGAAIASVIAEMVSLLFFILYTYIRTNRKKYSLFKGFHFEWSTLSHIFNTSVWTMLQAFISISTWFLFFIAVEHLGERPLAITNVLRNISSFFFIIISAFATTASTLTSTLIGSGEQNKVMGVFRQVSIVCYLFILPLMLLVCLFPTQVMRIYTDNLSLIQSAVPSYYVMIFVYLISVPANILFNTASGTGNTRSALGLELGALTLYVLSVVYIVIYLKADIAICWTTEYVYLASMLVFAYLYMKKGKWQHKKI
ncbi:MAG: MATE family efflux transporter [Odoribacter sp.]